MPSSMTVTWRRLYAEDFATSSTPAQVTDTVMGVGPVSVTPLCAAASDAAAAAAGVNVGDVYYLTTTGRLHTRMS